MVTPLSTSPFRRRNAMSFGNRIRTVYIDDVGVIARPPLWEAGLRPEEPPVSSSWLTDDAAECASNRDIAGCAVTTAVLTLVSVVILQVLLVVIALGTADYDTGRPGPSGGFGFGLTACAVAAAGAVGCWSGARPLQAQARHLDAGLPDRCRGRLRAGARRPHPQRRPRVAAAARPRAVSPRWPARLPRRRSPGAAAVAGSR